MKKDKKQRKMDLIIPGYPMGFDIQNTDLSYGLKNWKKSLKESNKIAILFERQSYKRKGEARKEEVDLARYVESKKKR